MLCIGKENSKQWHKIKCADISATENWTWTDSVYSITVCVRCKSSIQLFGQNNWSSLNSIKYIYHNSIIMTPYNNSNNKNDNNSILCVMYVPELYFIVLIDKIRIYVRLVL